MKLNLKNPLIFFDLETTGIDVAIDRIVEISYLKIYPNGDEESKTMKINPGMPIPPKDTNIQVIFHKKEQRTLSAAYKYYCDKNLEDAHSAEADTRATYEILQAQLDRYNDLPNDIDELSKFSSHNRNVDF